ncbi:hypothetical protein, partial [Nocardioides sp.]|uniref:hypothetical protein n=1 Tax=Nocardioides sp. TaxID=35761 RepID=UPI002ED889FF
SAWAAVSAPVPAPVAGAEPVRLEDAPTGAFPAVGESATPGDPAVNGTASAMDVARTTIGRRI